MAKCSPRRPQNTKSLLTHSCPACNLISNCLFLWSFNVERRKSVRRIARLDAFVFVLVSTKRYFPIEGLLRNDGELPEIYVQCKPSYG
jgi:hypothetical protein